MKYLISVASKDKLKEMDSLQWLSIYRMPCPIHNGTIKSFV